MNSWVRIAVGAACALAFAGGNAQAKPTNFNVLVFENFTGHFSDVEGALAAGGDISLNAYAVGKRLSPAADNANTLVAGRSIAFSNGQLYHGNAAAPTISGDAYLANGSQILGSPIDFAGLKQLYTDNSSRDADKTASGSVFNRYGTMTLTGGLSGLNVFDVAGADTNAVGLFHLDIPASAYALINVGGTSASFLNMGFDVGATPASHILFNFSDATSLTLGGIGFEGSILAPNADVSFDNGHLDGQLIARSMSGTGQINDFSPDANVFGPHSAPSNAPVAAVPEAGTWTMLIVGFLAVGASMRWRSAAASNREALTI